MKITLLIFSLLAIAGCSLILGPPESENELLFVEPAPNIPYDFLIQGQPSLLAMREGIYIWNIGNSWHIRIARIDESRFLYPVKPAFTGSITVKDGLILNIVKQNVDPVNDIYTTGRSIFFRFEPKNEIEGFDFEITPTAVFHCVTLDFRFNGKRWPGFVHLGSTMYVPEALPITVCDD